MNRRDYRNLRCPIMWDAIRGIGGLGSGWFTTNGAEGGTFGYGDRLEDENNIPILNEKGEWIRA